MTGMEALGGKLLMDLLIVAFGVGFFAGAFCALLVMR